MTEKIPEDNFSLYPAAYPPARGAAKNNISADAAGQILADITSTAYPPAKTCQIQNIKFSSNEYLLSIPPEDLIAVLSYSIPRHSFFGLTESPDMQEGETNLTPIYEWLVSNNKNLKLPEKYFFDKLKKESSAENLLKILENFMDYRGDEKAAQLQREISRKMRILSSRVFKDAVKYYKENFEFQKPDSITPDAYSFKKQKFNSPYYNMFFIFLEKDFTKYLTAMKTDDFKNFWAEIKNIYVLTPENGLQEILKQYFSPLSRKSIKSKQVQHVFNVLRKYFPTIDFKDADFAGNLLTEFDNYIIAGKAEFKMIDLENNIRNKAEYYYGILNTYKIKQELIPGEVMDFLSAQDADLKTLLQPNTAAAWEYIKIQPKGLKFYSFPDFLTRMKNIADALNYLKITIEELHGLLKLFETEFEKVKFSRLADINKLKDINVRKLMVDGNFINYISQISKKYSYFFEYIDFNEIIALILNYDGKNKPKFETLNNLIKILAGGRECPELNLEDYDLKVKILTALRKKNFKFTVNKDRKIFSSAYNNPNYQGSRGTDEDFTDISASELENVFKKIMSQTDTALYNALSSDWKIKNIELDAFIHILAYDKEDFYLNRNNAEKYCRLTETYNTLGSVDGYNPTPRSSLEGLLSVFTKYLLENEKFFNDERVKDNIFKYFLNSFEYDGGIKQSNLAALGQLNFLQDKNFDKIIETLETNYGFSAEQIECLFNALLDPEYLGDIPLSMNGKKYPKEFKELFEKHILNSETLKIFNKLKVFYKDKDSGDILIMSLELKDVSCGAEIINILNNNLKFDTTDSDNFEFIYKKILTQRHVVKNLFDLKYIEFYNKIVSHFYEGCGWVELIPYVSEIYDYVNSRPELYVLLFSKKYKEVINYIAKEFYIADLDASALLPILELAKKFDETKIKKIIENLGKNFSSNDLYLIAKVIQNEDFEALLSNKEAMRDELLREIYQKYPESERKQERLIESSERPPLEELSGLPLFMFRAVLLERALQSADFLRKIGEIAVSDMNNSFTEFGGVIYIDDEKRLSIKTVESSAVSDNSYIGEDSPFIMSGICGFHCHFQKNAYNYSGPSGILGKNGAGDLYCSYALGSTGLVLTNMGHPKDENGKEIKNKLIVNCDLYCIDKSNPYKPTARIIDLGSRIVPLK